MQSNTHCRGLFRLHGILELHMAVNVAAACRGLRHLLDIDVDVALDFWEGGHSVFFQDQT